MPELQRPARDHLLRGLLQTTWRRCQTTIRSLPPNPFYCCSTFPVGLLYIYDGATMAQTQGSSQAVSTLFHSVPNAQQRRVSARETNRKRHNTTSIPYIFLQKSLHEIYDNDDSAGEEPLENLVKWLLATSASTAKAAFYYLAFVQRRALNFKANCLRSLQIFCCTSHHTTLD